MAETRASRYAAEACIGEHGNMLAERQHLQCGGDLVDLLHPRAERASADEDDDVAMRHRAALDGIDSGGLGDEHLRRPRVPKHAVFSYQRRVDRRALHHAPLGRKVADGEADRGRQAALAGSVGGHDYVISVNAVKRPQPVSERPASFTLLPPIQIRIQRLTRHRLHAGIEKPGAAQVQHHLRNGSRKEHLHGGEVTGAVGQRVDQTRNLPVDRCPIGRRGTFQPGRMSDRRDMQQQVRRATERGMQYHRVADRGVGQDISRAYAELRHTQHRPCRTRSGIEPDWLTGRRECCVRQRQTKSLRDDLRRRRSPEELAASARRCTGATTHLCGVLQRDLLLREPGADGLDFAGVFAVLGQQRDTAGNENTGIRAGRGKRHHHGWQALVAGRDAEYALARRQ